ncbi:hypothetical protein IE53DRAFT_386234 [Violaceomyces palustris]|uniref:Uncharacterized protein n=1 Tax=Violaceomyces palustris TaxID=1673888 RepID=A0ACD0P044_9BASI|nr:hypothetical protein IE53DRAFT_386234 [Violaceomyces palustris]
MDSLHNLRSSLDSDDGPSAKQQQQYEDDLSKHFKAAALQLTTLYKSSIASNKSSFQAGYLHALTHILDLIQSPHDLAGLDSSSSSSSSASSNPTDHQSAQRLRWLTGYLQRRIEAMAIEDEDDRDRSANMNLSTGSLRDEPPRPPQNPPRSAPSSLSSQKQRQRQDSEATSASTNETGHLSRAGTPNAPPPRSSFSLSSGLSRGGSTTPVPAPAIASRSSPAPCSSADQDAALLRSHSGPRSASLRSSFSPAPSFFDSPSESCGGHSTTPNLAHAADESANATPTSSSVSLNHQGQNHSSAPSSPLTSNVISSSGGGVKRRHGLVPESPRIHEHGMISGGASGELRRKAARSRFPSSSLVNSASTADESACGAVMIGGSPLSISSSFDFRSPLKGLELSPAVGADPSSPLGKALKHRNSNAGVMVNQASEGGRRGGGGGGVRRSSSRRGLRPRLGLRAPVTHSHHTGMEMSDDPEDDWVDEEDETANPTAETVFENREGARVDNDSASISGSARARKRRKAVMEEIEIEDAESGAREDQSSN